MSQTALAPAARRPPLTLYLGPSGSGKTARCLEQLAAAPDRTRLVLPSRDHVSNVRAAISADAARAVVTSSELLGQLAGPGDADLMSRMSRHLVLRGIVDQCVGPDDYFARMPGTPGFVDALAACFRELALSAVQPDDLEAGADIAPGGESGRKCREIAALYRAYRRFLAERGLRDEDDAPQYALQRLRGDRLADYGFATLLVDGFFRFAAAWRLLFAELAGRGVEVVVTLPHEPGRALLFASSERTLETLRAEFAVDERPLSPPTPGRRPTVLERLERRLFEGSEPAGPSGGGEEAAADTPLLVHDAPNPYAEAEMAVRALRREHDRLGTPWSRCAVFLRTPGYYGPMLSSLCERYEVPLALQQPVPAADNPLVRTLLTLLRVYRAGWRREDVVAFLRSRYVLGAGLAADFVRRRARRRGLREGRGGWERLASGPADGADAATPVIRQMLVWQARLQPDRRTPEQFADAVRELLPAFALARAQEDDRPALDVTHAVLQEIARAGTLTTRGPVRFEEFVDDLQGALQAATYVPPAPEDGVAVLEPYDARQRPLQLAIVMGLTERSFPRRADEDPFLRDDERDALRAAGLPLEDRRSRADDERLLFYLAVTAPSERLILSYPRTSDEADTLPSFYLDEVRLAVGQVPVRSRTLADVAPRDEECVTDRDRLLAACAADGPGPAPGPSAPAAALRATRALPALPRLEAHDLRKAYAAERAYGISEIETYGLCPFQHFLRHGARLYPEVGGGGPADRGTLYHAVLRRWFRAHASECPEADLLREQLLAELDVCLEERPVDALPHRRRMMERALRDALCGFAEREVRCRELFGLRPAHAELAFGMAESAAPDDPEIDPDGPRDYDPASTPRPLVIPLEGAGAEARLCGAMDRVDLAADGCTALVMDYKLGSSVEFPAMREGRSLQIPLYLLAIERLWQKVGGVGCYDSPHDAGRRRFVRTECVDQRIFRPVPGVEPGNLVQPVSREQFAEVVAAATASVRAAATGIRGARVPPTPGDHCRLCDYGDVCRTSRDGTHDGEPAAAADVGPPLGGERAFVASPAGVPPGRADAT